MHKLTPELIDALDLVQRAGARVESVQPGEARMASATVRYRQRETYTAATPAEAIRGALCVALLPYAYRASAARWGQPVQHVYELSEIRRKYRRSPQRFDDAIRMFVDDVACAPVHDTLAIISERVDQCNKMGMDLLEVRRQVRGSRPEFLAAVRSQHGIVLRAAHADMDEAVGNALVYAACAGKTPPAREMPGLTGAADFIVGADAIVDQHGLLL